MKIAIIDDYQNVVRSLKCFDLLKEHEVTVFNSQGTPKADLIKQLQDFEGIVLTRERTIFDSEVLAQLPRLKVLSQTGRPGEHIDANFCTSRGIAILAGTGSPVAPAELTWALIMSAQKRLPTYMKSLLAGQWQSADYLQSDLRRMGGTLKGKTLGIFGLGKIGSLVAQFGQAFGMKVLVFGQESSKKKAEQLGYSVAATQEQLFMESDILSIHLRSSKETSEIVKLRHLSLMKNRSIFVNTSRAKLIENNAIRTCLNSETGPLLFALDVFDEEPLTSGFEWLKNDRVVATPHIGFVEESSFENYYGTAFQNILNFEKQNYESLFNVELLKTLKG